MILLYSAFGRRTSPCPLQRRGEELRVKKINITKQVLPFGEDVGGVWQLASMHQTNDKYLD